mmetsp:Transcript_70801/g.207455  ORF Transcript_70801/g.207455 Transcript_70801/m.207455 type:complete len:243 (+) Transcript_70801:931-1659(+)
MLVELLEDVTVTDDSVREVPSCACSGSKSIASNALKTSLRARHMRMVAGFVEDLVHSGSSRNSHSRRKTWMACSNSSSLRFSALSAASCALWQQLPSAGNGLSLCVDNLSATSCVASPSCPTAAPPANSGTAAAGAWRSAGDGGAASCACSSDGLLGCDCSGASCGSLVPLVPLNTSGGNDEVRSGLAGCTSSSSMMSGFMPGSIRCSQALRYVLLHELPAAGITASARCPSSPSSGGQALR